MSHTERFGELFSPHRGRRYAIAECRYAMTEFRYAMAECRYAMTECRYAMTECCYAMTECRYAAMPWLKDSQLAVGEGIVQTCP